MFGQDAHAGHPLAIYLLQLLWNHLETSVGKSQNVDRLVKGDLCLLTLNRKPLSADGLTHCRCCNTVLFHSAITIV